MIRVELPQSLCHLANATKLLSLEISGPVTQRTILDAVEARYPALKGTMRDHATQRRRALVRFYACNQDLSHEEPDTPVPAAVAAGEETFLIIGAIAGG